MDNSTRLKCERLARKARKSIWDYCTNECKSYCCRKGYLLLDNSNVDLVTQNRKKELLKNKTLLTTPNGGFSLFMGKTDQPCPSLMSDFRCKIHENKKRPSACAEFPIFIHEDSFHLSCRCPAVIEGKLYPFEVRLRNMGLKQINGQMPQFDTDSFELD